MPGKLQFTAYSSLPVNHTVYKISDFLKESHIQIFFCQKHRCRYLFVNINFTMAVDGTRFELATKGYFSAEARMLDTAVCAS